MLSISAFVALGFLVGNLIGLTAESVVSSLLPLLFAFGGGSAVAFLGTLAPDARRNAGAAILSLSMACLLGTYVGIVVSEYQILTPPEVRAARIEASIEEKKYMRSFLSTKAGDIDQLKTTGRITADEAYEALRALLAGNE